LDNTVIRQVDLGVLLYILPNQVKTYTFLFQRSRHFMIMTRLYVYLHLLQINKDTN